MNDRWPEVQPPDLSIGLPGSLILGGRFLDRALGCVLGSAVGDALGAPFEFGPAGQFSARFPKGSAENEMIGGGPWLPGEFTDDTQMAILEALAFTATCELESSLPVAFGNFVAWAESGPKDVGISTRAVLTDPRGVDGAAAAYFSNNPTGSAGNGSIMRASFVAARWSFANETGTALVGRKYSELTHGDPAAGEGRALLHQILHGQRLSGAGLSDKALSRYFNNLDDTQQPRFIEARDPDPPMELSNGTVWGCLRDAVIAVRRTDNFKDCMRMACDVAGDVDTVAAVAGAIAGMTYGADAIPARWVESLQGEVLGRTYDAQAIVDLHNKMLAVPNSPPRVAELRWAKRAKVEHYLWALSDTKLSAPAIDARLKEVEREFQITNEQRARSALVTEENKLRRELRWVNDVADLSDLESAFVEEAAEYGHGKRWSYADWKAKGVSDETLRAAGINP